MPKKEFNFDFDLNDTHKPEIQKLIRVLLTQFQFFGSLFYEMGLDKERSEKAMVVYEDFKEIIQKNKAGYDAFVLLFLDYISFMYEYPDDNFNLVDIENSIIMELLKTSNRLSKN